MMVPRMIDDVGGTMRRNHRNFTLVEVLMIFFVILVVLADISLNNSDG